MALPLLLHKQQVLLSLLHYQIVSCLEWCPVNRDSQNLGLAWGIGIGLEFGLGIGFNQYRQWHQDWDRQNQNSQNVGLVLGLSWELALWSAFGLVMFMVIVLSQFCQSWSCVKSSKVSFSLSTKDSEKHDHCIIPELSAVTKINAAFYLFQFCVTSDLDNFL